MEDEPDFEFDPEHKYQVGEKIYVIDPNGFDIWEGEIQEIGITTWSVHFPDYPQDDRKYRTTNQFLLRTEGNKKIFEEQEKARKENNEEEEETTKSDTEDGDFTGGEDFEETQKPPRKYVSPSVQAPGPNNYPGLTSFPHFS